VSSRPMWRIPIRDSTRGSRERSHRKLGGSGYLLPMLIGSWSYVPARVYQVSPPGTVHGAYRSDTDDQFWYLGMGTSTNDLHPTRPERQKRKPSEIARSAVARRTSPAQRHVPSAPTSIDEAQSKSMALDLQCQNPPETPKGTIPPLSEVLFLCEVPRLLVYHGRAPMRRHPGPRWEWVWALSSWLLQWRTF
jgi:hypothetical protein